MWRPQRTAVGHRLAARTAGGQLRLQPGGGSRGVCRARRPNGRRGGQRQRLGPPSRKGSRVVVRLVSGSGVSTRSSNAASHRDCHTIGLSSRPLRVGARPSHGLMCKRAIQLRLLPCASAATLTQNSTGPAAAVVAVGVGVGGSFGREAAHLLRQVLGAPAS